MCGPTGCDGGACADMSQGANYPMMAAPMQAPMQFAPATTPVLMPPGQTSARPYNPGYNVQPVGYNPGYSAQPAGYYPNYGYGYGYPAAMPNYPMNYSNPMGQMPYYWNPMGGR